MVDDPRQVGVAQPGQQLGLTLELSLGVATVAGVFFQRYRLLQSHIPGTIDGAEATLADESGDPIAIVNDLAGSECQDAS